MSTQSLKRLSVRAFSRFRYFLESIRQWIERRPALSDWFYPNQESSWDSDHRDHNHRMFAGFHEQERMLADQPRMDFYAAAISRHIRRGDTVVDLGTGTGILAALASRSGATRVYAIDHSEILSHAKALAAANTIENVEFVATHSTAFHPKEKVDVIVHEQMGDGLFDEEMVANVTDLRDRILKSGGLILPSRFELYCEPIKVSDRRHVPFIWELNVHGYDYSSLASHRPTDRSYYNLASTDLSVVDYFLGKPEPLLTFDLHTLNQADLPKMVRFTRSVLRAGRFDGYAVFFNALVDDDLRLTSNPLDPGRAPHWGFRILRSDRDTVEKGDELDVRLTVGHWPDFQSWRWQHTKRQTGSARTEPPVK